MNKKGLLLAVLALGLAPVAQAAQSYTSAGCGLGTVLFKGKNGKVHLILAATTNGTFGNQTFGISSETLECTSDGVVKNDKQVEVYAAANFQKLSKEMAQGGGEYLNGLSTLLGATSAEQKAALSKLAQVRYEKLFPTATTDSASMLTALRAEMASDATLKAL